MMASVLVLSLVTACTSGRSDDDVTELESLGAPEKALAWLADDAETTEVEGREVPARLVGLVQDGWPDDGAAAADVLVAALTEAPADEDRARVTAQLMHVLAHTDLEEESVREAAATVLAGHADDVERIASGAGLSIDDQWTIVVDDAPVPSVEPSTVGDALEQLGEDGLVVLTGLAHERRSEIVNAATSAGDPRTVETLTSSETSGVVTDGTAFGTSVDLVLSRSFSDQEERLSALSTAVEAAFAAPADASASTLATAAQGADARQVSDVSTALQVLNINALLEAGYLDISVDPTYGLPSGTVIDDRLDPGLLDGEAAADPDAAVVSSFNGWLVGEGPSTAPYSLIGDAATGAAQVAAS